MTHEEILQQISEIQEWDSQERRRLLKEQSVLKVEKLRPLRQKCSELGHEEYFTGDRNILGERFIACKWCGAHLGSED